MIDKKFLKAVGALALKLRKEKGWSQQYLADEVETAQRHISRIETGEKDIRISTLRRVATALGKKPSELLAEAGY